MNCDDFNDRLPEYLDETLTAAELAAARGHVQQCAACRQALARQEAFAKSIGLSLRRQTQGLFLRPETRQNILNALEPREPAPTAWENFQACFAAIRPRPALACLAIFCLLLLIFASRLYRHGNNSTRHIAVRDGRCHFIVDIPVQTEMYVYRARNNTVVDAIVTGVSIADADFSENIGPSSLSKSHSN